MDSTPSAVLPPGCLFWGAWTSALLPLLVQGLQGALPSIRERRGPAGACTFRGLESDLSQGSGNGALCLEGGTSYPQPAGLGCGVG